MTMTSPTGSAALLISSSPPIAYQQSTQFSTSNESAPIAISRSKSPQASPVNQNQSSGPPSVERISWGINWRKPVLICSLLFTGLIMSLGHHLYYNSMNGTKAGDGAKQAWPIRFGTAFAFLVTACLQAVTATAFGQYIWTVVRRKPLTIASLDRLFALTADPAGLFSLEILKDARIAVLIGCIFWCLGLSGVAPPATLTVTTKAISIGAYVPVLDFSSDMWTLSALHGELGSLTNYIASLCASNFNPVPISAPVSGLDWSYDLKFFGPTLQCEEANTSEQVIFSNLMDSFEHESLFTFSQVNDSYWNASCGRNKFDVYCSRLLYWSFPYPATPANVWFPVPNGPMLPLDSGQILIQTSTSSIVCNAANASFDLTIASINGTQQVTRQIIQTVSTITFEGYEANDYPAYYSHFLAMGYLLVGNITMDGPSATVISGPNPQSFDSFKISSALTNLWGTGLIACEDIQQSPFKDLESGNSNYSETWVNTFPSSQLGKCRNGTILQAVEDLSNNVTISFLSSPELINDNTTFRNIPTSNTINIYEYHPLYLLLSYGLGLLFAFVAAAIGLYSIYLNGVSHSTAFSAIIATTRNHELDSLTQGASLGAEPLKTEIHKAKLRFGPLIGISSGFEKEPGNTKEGAPHVAFGFEKSVGSLLKGGTYI